MLVLGRKSNESIQVGENIKITIIKIGGDRVQIGIDAPREVSILRHELTNQDAGKPQQVFTLPISDFVGTDGFEIAQV